METLKSSYTIIGEKNIVIEYHIGTWTLANYLVLKQNILKEPNFKPGLNHLIYFKNIEFKVTPDELKKFANFMRENNHKLGNRNVAFITNTPNQVVTTTIYKNLVSKNNVVEIFSTATNALNWLSYNPSDIEEIKEELRKLIKRV